MIRRLATPKRVFTYTVGQDPTVFTVEDLELHPHMDQMYANWLEREKEYERDWRNHELTSSDWMLMPDATYAGEPLAGSQKIQDIIDYRKLLREYNLTTDLRPEKPEWYIQ